jgi:hypothetical protein
VLDGAVARRKQAQRLIAHLPAVAVGAVQEVPAPTLPCTLDLGQLVGRTGGDQKPSRCQSSAVAEPEREPRLDQGNALVDELDGVAACLVPSQSEQLGR